MPELCRSIQLQKVEEGGRIVPDQVVNHAGYKRGCATEERLSIAQSGIFKLVIEWSNFQATWEKGSSTECPHGLWNTETAIVLKSVDPQWSLLGFLRSSSKGSE